jgi:hypothetical protein
MQSCSRFFTATRQEKKKCAKSTPEMATASAALPPDLHVQPYYCRKDPELEAARHESFGNQGSPQEILECLVRVVEWDRAYRLLQVTQPEGNSVEFVCISCDPEADTPERLEDYAKLYQAVTTRGGFSRSRPL